MFYFISLMIIWLICEKVLALITLSHMANVPPLSPIRMKNTHANNKPHKLPKPMVLSAWEKFTLIRELLKQGSTEFGISAQTSNTAQVLFLASRACQTIAIICTLALIIKTAIA